MRVQAELDETKIVLVSIKSDHMQYSGWVIGGAMLEGGKVVASGLRLLAKRSWVMTLQVILISAP